MKNILIILLVSVVIFQTGCEDFIEENISNESITLNSPPDNYQTSSATQIFWWNEMNGAESYQIQIVKGTFQTPFQFIVDTNVTLNNFTYSLFPGSFQWRVRGLNNGYKSPYSTNTLTIDSSLDLNNQMVTLLSPVNNLTTNQSTFTFSWLEMYNADEYRLQIMDSLNGNYIVDVTISENNHATTLAEGSFIWQVRAINAISITQASMRNLYIDLTPPTSPVLISPGDNSLLVFGAIDSLIWQSDITSISDTLYIAEDSLFGNVMSYAQTESFYLINQLPGDYFWKVKSVDLAGNEGSFSAYRKFIIQ